MQLRRFCQLLERDGDCTREIELLSWYIYNSLAMLTLTQLLPAHSKVDISLTLALTAMERTRSRQTFEISEGNAVRLHLPRGTVLQDGDLLQTEKGDAIARVIAKPEPVIEVTAKTPVELLRAAYHLGNRHVKLEIAATYLRLEPDPVLQEMLEQMGLGVREEVLPFQPETGAYH